MSDDKQQLAPPRPQEGPGGPRAGGAEGLHPPRAEFRQGTGEIPPHAGEGADQGSGGASGCLAPDGGALPRRGADDPQKRRQPLWWRRLNPSGNRRSGHRKLSPHQARSGLACLRDTITERGWPPLIWTRPDGCKFCADPAELQADEVAVIRGKLTEIRRFITGTVAPHAVLQPKGRWIKHLNTQLNSVESTLDVIADFTTPDRWDRPQSDRSHPPS
ncbi:hypothetical protein QFZ58_000019 [Streptomyces sp. B1I3]|nr:hypothetical protein [Streptomyces sp. B1I3]